MNEKESNTSRRPWRFRKPWRLEGMLYTLAPLHIGSGQVIYHPDLMNEEGPVEISACMRSGNIPIIPGSVLKGALRAWAERHIADKELLKCVFGSGPVSETDQGRGGKAAFHDALLTIERTGPTPLPFWNRETRTYIETSVCMDRVSGTVAEQKLFYLETVPAGVGFKVTVAGRCDADEEIELVLAAFNGFGCEEDPILLGADTASGKGRFRWEQGKIFQMDQCAVQEWIEKESRTVFHLEMKECNGETLESLRSNAAGLAANGSKEVFSVPIILEFDSHFLVNDPPTEREKEESKKLYEETENRDDLVGDFRPRLDERGRVILPAKSFRGALRSQAEKIIRTLGGRACNPGGKNSTSDEGGGRTCFVQEKNDFEQLCLACRMFGAPGWKTPVTVSDFTLIPGDYEFTLQEFVAIDRFTGGGKDSAKFNACAIYKPRFQGCLEVDLKRLRGISGGRDKDSFWELGLLGLVLRDLREGDITFGFGAAKGYGTCTARIPVWDDEKEFRKPVKKGLKKFYEIMKRQSSSRNAS